VTAADATPPAGPLTGVRVLEVGGIGPGPFAGLLLADLGAAVTRIERTQGGADSGSHRILLRGRRQLTVDLKDPRGQEVVLRLADTSDVLIEGFRPGVMERLGLGPDTVLTRNPRLVYGRMTGWGQDGPLADSAGHDINYIAVAGALQPIAAPDLTPVAPLNMLGDFGGGGMLLVAGILAALIHARTTGQGQVVDAAIVDGAALLTAMLHSMRAGGRWDAPRGQNLFDGGAPFYGVYQCADERWLAVGAIEPRFYAALLRGLGLTGELASLPQHDRHHWPATRERFAAVIAGRALAEWLAIFAGADACVSEVVDPARVTEHPHLALRRTYVEDHGLLQPAPAPRFSATPLAMPAPAPEPGSSEPGLLTALGLSHEDIQDLIADGVVGAPLTETVGASPEG
jgi:alpha-methylacyl-CoA racemase